MATAPVLPHVQLSALLYDAFDEEGIDADVFADTFAEWKALGAAGEFSSFYWGKDGAYSHPQRGGKMVLRHVHLPPSDPTALAEWAKMHRRRRGRRTSNTCLLYAHDRTHGYLLLYVAREPHGHSISDMSVPASARLMNQLADAADAFIHDGSITL